jgi:hypothetical protein
LSTPQASLDRRGGLANVIDIIIAPGAAFERLRLEPVWGWAFLVGCLLTIAGSLLTIPAVLQAVERTLPAQLAANPNISSLPADQQAKLIARTTSFTRSVIQFQWIFTPVVLLGIALVQALIMLIANAVGHGDGSFKKYFALSMTVGVVGWGLSSLFVGVIAEIRGPASFEDSTAVQAALPGLATLVPGAHGALQGFLAPFQVFNLWAVALLALGMTVVGRIPRPAAWASASAMLVIGALLSAAGAARQG